MPISKAEKTVYNEHIKDIKSQIEASRKRIEEVEKKRKEFPRIMEYYQLEIILEIMKTILLNISMSDASLEILNIKNEKSLKDARTAFYEVLQRLETIFGNEVDRSLKDNEDILKRLDKLNPQQALVFMKRLNYILSTLIDKIGETSKWKWSFVDLQARVAVITKNMINFTDVHKYRDPRKEFYRERQQLVKLCKQSLKDAAQQYRTKYEQSTKVPQDMLKSIEFLSVLRRIHVLFAESDEAGRLKVTIDALRARMEADEKEKDKKSSKK
jgi:hypothetical protein